MKITEIFTTFFILGLRVHWALAIIAYDCGAPGMNITTLSLKTIQECNIPIPNPITTPATIQLLQTTEYVNIHIIQCKIEIHRQIFHCGMWSHASVVSFHNIEYIKEVSRSDCKEMHDTRSLKLNEYHHNDLEANATISRPIQLAGSEDSDGKCLGGSYSDQYGSWKDVTVSGQIFITLVDYYATVKAEKNELILRSGTRCKYTDEKCMDSFNGNTYWKAIEPSKCDLDGFAIIYQGTAEKIRDKSITHQNQEFYKVNSDDYTFALATKGATEVCGYRFIKTEHPRLYIFDTTSVQPLNKKVGIFKKNVDLVTYVNSKFVYLAHHLKNEIVNLYNDVILQQCALERKVLGNTLAIAAIAPAEFAYYMMKSSGYIAHIAGEVVHIAKCIPVEVNIRRTSQCFQELPVTRGNNSLFMRPVTHVLVHTGTQIDCINGLNPMFNINNVWVQTMPHFAPATPPKEISPQTKNTWEFTDPGNLINSGLYSVEDLHKMQEDIMFPVEEPAVLHTIARGATGQENIYQGVDIENMITFEKIQGKFEAAMGTLASIIYNIGHGSTYIFGFYILIKIVKFVVDMVIHGIALHAVFGWSFVLIGSIWDSITHFLLHMNNHKKNQKQDDVELGQLNDDTKQRDENPNKILSQGQQVLTKNEICASHDSLKPCIQNVRVLDEIMHI